MSANTYREAIQSPSDRVIVALDNMNWPQAINTMGEIGGYVGMAKANSLAQRRGWEQTIETISSLGAYTMADGKFHDIPETVRLQAKEVTDCGASLITVHASGGKAMLEAAVKGRNEAKEDFTNPFLVAAKNRLGGLLGITVLTSLDSGECVSIYGDEPEKKVVQFAHIAVESGLDGIVCSGKELPAIRAIATLDELITVVPGITPEWAKKAGDQKRVVTPKQALLDGADYLVIGRALTQPPEGISRLEAVQRINQELTDAM